MNYNYDYGYGYDYEVAETASNVAGGVFAAMGVYFLVMIAIGVFSIICMWKLFKKAGKQGWEAIVPIYNMIVLIEIAGLPLWYIALFFVPIANIYAIFKIYIELAHKFGKSTGFGVAMVFFSIICIPILAFGSAEYQGRINSEPVNNNYNPYQPTNPNVENSYTNNYQQPVVNQPQQPVQPQNTFVFNEQVQQPVEQTQPMQQPTPTIFDNPAPVQSYTEQPTSPVTEPVAEINPVQPQQPTITDIPQPMTEQVKYCPSCGNKTNATADTCFMCGHKFQ